MSLRDLANPLFRAVCGAGLLAGAAMPPLSASADAPLSQQPVISDQCALDPAITYDSENRAWMRITAHTADDLPVTFSLHLETALPPMIDGYDEMVCKSVTNNLYNLAALAFREQFLARRYAELPASAPAFRAAVLSDINNKLAETTGGLPLRIDDLSISKVTAPGLDSTAATALLDEGIRYNYEDAPDPANVTAISWDGRSVHYKIDVTFTPAKDAYFALGPNDEGIRRRVFAAAGQFLKDQTATREAGCIEDDLRYIRARVMEAMLADPVLDRYVHLLGLQIQAQDIPPATATTPKENRPERPVCITQLIEKLGLEPGR